MSADDDDHDDYSVEGEIDNEAIQQSFMDLDTPAVSDAMDSLGIPGALHGIQARVPGVAAAGPVYTVQYRSFDRVAGEFHNAGNYIDDVPAGSIVLIDNEGRTDCTNWGDIMTEAAQMRGIAGTVVHGTARDIRMIRDFGYPLFSTGVYMVSGKNRVKVTGVQVAVTIGDVTVRPGDWIFADDNGVLAIPAARVMEVLERAERIDATENRIREAVRGGMPLVEARSRFRYDRPWDGAGAR